MPLALHRAFQNLVLNALDAMPAGGTLTLRTSERSGHVLIEISDTGKGLTPEECSRLFTPYYTTKHQGTGLGLAIVQSIVSDHHGSISVSSEEGCEPVVVVVSVLQDDDIQPTPWQVHRQTVSEQDAVSNAEDVAVE